MNKCLHCQQILEINQVDFCCLGCLNAYRIIQDNGFANFYSSRIINHQKPPLKPDLQQYSNNLKDLYEIKDLITNKNNIFEINFKINGLHCGACVWLIESLIKKQDSVLSARVNLTQQTIKIKWQSHLRENENFEENENKAYNFINLITEIGYKVSPLNEDSNLNNDDTYQEKILFKAMAVAGFGVGNIMLFSFALWFNDSAIIKPATRQFLHLISLIIALPVLIYSGRIFVTSAINSLRKRLPNMDIAISMAIILASIVSIFQTFRGQENVYFDSVVMLIFFLLIGRYLDFKVRKKAFNIASEFSSLQANYGKVLIDEKIVSLPAKKIQKDMILIVASGEKIACDGLVIEGQGEIDNSLISGESKLQKITIDSLVFGGSINIGNPIKVKVVKPANSGLLSEIISLVNSAETKKNIYIRISDQFSKYYTPAVHILAILTFGIWFFVFKESWEIALINATAVLIITCPCALALAIPVVQSIAISNFLKSGIIFKNGQALESLNKIEYVVFDKTGSLTYGTPQLQNIYQIIDDKIVEIPIDYKNLYLDLAKKLAKFSNHPIAKSLSNFDKIKDEKTYNFLNVEELKGLGLKATINNKIIKLGSAHLCEINQNFDYEKIIQIKNQAISQIKCFLSYDNKKFILIFRDEIKRDAKFVINYLKNLNKKIILLSGDDKGEVKRIAEICGIDEYYWGKNPIEKTQILEKLNYKNIKFMMIGDGVNDAPSLALSNVSLSFSKATDISQNIADIIINSSELTPIIDIFKKSKKALLLMKQNLFFSLIYNIIAVPFAVLGFINPLFSAIAMSSSSLIVILNSIRTKS